MDTALQYHRAPCFCRFNTTALAAASSGFRVVATDETANSTTSAFVATRLVRNTVFSVSLDDLGAYLMGNTTGAPGKIDAGDTLSFTYSQQVNLAPRHSGLGRGGLAGDPSPARWQRSVPGHRKTAQTWWTSSGWATR